MIYILLPAYNEEAAIPELIPGIAKILNEKGMPYEIVVVDDGSRDQTPDLLKKLQSAKTYHLSVITHPINRGLGETERDGFEFIARKSNREDIIVRVEGDATHEPQYIFDLINKLKEGYDVVNTSRFQPGGDQLGLDNYRKVISRLANWFMSFIFGIKGVKDYSCGFRAYRAGVIKDAIEIYGNAFIQLKGLGFTSTLEMMVKLNVIGCRFAEVPFVLRYDKKQSSSKMISSVTTLGYLTMALLYHWPFGGWKSQYRGLKKLYIENPEKAVKDYNIYTIKRRTVSRIGG